MPVPLPDARRILVAGASGSGKTTLAGRIAEATGVPHTEIDGLYWRAGWTRNPRFTEEVRSLAATGSWVTEWQYSDARPILAARAELLIWLDLPRVVVLARVLRRTLRRQLGRVPMWHGNLEPPLWTFFTDRDPPRTPPPRRFAARRNRRVGPSSAGRCGRSASIRIG